MLPVALMPLDDDLACERVEGHDRLVEVSVLFCRSGDGVVVELLDLLHELRVMICH